MQKTNRIYSDYDLSNITIFWCYEYSWTHHMGHCIVSHNAAIPFLTSAAFGPFMLSLIRIWRQTFTGTDNTF